MTPALVLIARFAPELIVMLFALGFGLLLVALRSFLVSPRWHLTFLCFAVR